MIKSVASHTKTWKSKIFSNGALGSMPLLSKWNDNGQGTCLGYPGAEIRYPNYCLANLGADLGNPDNFIGYGKVVFSKLVQRCFSNLALNSSSVIRSPAARPAAPNPLNFIKRFLCFGDEPFSPIPHNVKKKVRKYGHIKYLQGRRRDDLSWLI